MKKGSLILAILAGVLSFGIVAYADTAWNTPTVYGSSVADTYWTGYVEWNSGIHATQGWANSNTTLTWNISYAGGLYNYYYAWSTIPVPVPGDISHIIIELTPGTIIERGLEEYYGVEYPNPQKGVWDDSNGNPLLPSYGFYGAKITPDGASRTVFEFSFTSEQEPVWGNFYAKDGGGMGADAVVAWNTGLDALAKGGSSGVFIARPDGDGKCVQTPEPGTLMLLGAGLVGLWVVR